MNKREKARINKMLEEYDSYIITGFSHSATVGVRFNFKNPEDHGFVPWAIISLINSYSNLVEISPRDALSMINEFFDDFEERIDINEIE